jgi:hypothetical protein
VFLSVLSLERLFFALFRAKEIHIWIFRVALALGAHFEIERIDQTTPPAVLDGEKSDLARFSHFNFSTFDVLENSLIALWMALGNAQTDQGEVISRHTNFGRNLDYLLEFPHVHFFPETPNSNKCWVQRKCRTLERINFLLGLFARHPVVQI